MKFSISSMAGKRRIVFDLSIIVFFGVLIYLNVLNSPFQFDDYEFILQNRHIKGDVSPLKIWNYTPRKFFSLYTIALNYNWWGEDPFGYHCINLLLHIITAFFVYGVMLLLFLSPGLLKSKFFESRYAFASMVSLVFLVHPLQTESVTYIWQRSTVLGGAFYLSSLFLYILARVKRKNYLFYLSLLLFIAGLFAKGSIITLPFVILLCEMAFFGLAFGLVRDKIREYSNVVLMAIVFLFWSMPFINKYIRLGHLLSGTSGLSRTSYLLTQFGVILRYIRLLFVPIGQNVDHYVCEVHSFFTTQSLIPFLILIIILFVAGLNWKSYRMSSFGIYLFFLMLLPTSSIFPLSTFMFEHRLYLPIIGFSVFLVYSLYIIVKRDRDRRVVSIMLIVILSLFTITRNTFWNSRIMLMEDSIKKSPLNARPHLVSGGVYYTSGDVEKAVKLFERAIALAPGYPDPHNNLGLIYMDAGNMVAAEREFEAAIRAQKDFVDSYVNLAYIFVMKRDYDGAKKLLKEALSYDFSDTILSGLGNIAYLEKDKLKAKKFFLKATELNPNNSIAYYNLGNIFAEKKEYDDAIELYKKAADIDPFSVDVYKNMGIVCYYMKDYRASEAYFKKALRLDPKRNDIYRNLANLYYEIGEDKKAEYCLGQAKRFKGNSPTGLKALMGWGS